MQRTSLSVQRSPPLPAAVTGLRARFSAGAAEAAGVAGAAGAAGAVSSLGALCARACLALNFML